MFHRLLAAVCLLIPTLALGQGAPPAAQVCAACHGEAGPSPHADVPTIHGLPEVVIEIALYDFRGHARPCRRSACSEAGSCPDMDMCTVAGPMNHDAMEALARWYDAQPWVPAAESYNPALAARGRLIHEERCEMCHTAGGTDPTDEASILRGQRSAYLLLAIEDYRSGRRTAVAAMDDELKALEPGEVDALIAYYASPVEGGG